MLNELCIPDFDAVVNEPLCVIFTLSSVSVVFLDVLYLHIDQLPQTP